MATPRDTEVVRAKNFDIYLRNLPPVPPSHMVPVPLQRPRASHPDPAVQMKLRSSFPPAFARAHVRVWDSLDLPPHAHGAAGRPAAVVDDGYAAHRVQMLCSYWAFASQYAPQVSADRLASPDRAPLLVAVPMGYTGSCVAALTPRNGGCFAMELVDSVPLLQQIQAFKDFLPCDVEPQQMGRTRTPRADVIFAMPYVGRVEGALTDVAEWSSVPTAHSAAWCCSGALSSDQVLLVSIAFERAKSFVQAGPWLSGQLAFTMGQSLFTRRGLQSVSGRHMTTTTLTLSGKTSWCLREIVASFSLLPSSVQTPALASLLRFSIMSSLHGMSAPSLRRRPRAFLTSTLMCSSSYHTLSRLPPCIQAI